MEYYFMRMVMPRIRYCDAAMLIPMLQTGINDNKPIIIGEIDYEVGLVEPICGLPLNLKEADYVLFAVIKDDVLDGQEYVFSHLKKYIYVKRYIIENHSTEIILLYLSHTKLVKKGSNQFEYLA